MPLPVSKLMKNDIFLPIFTDEEAVLESCANILGDDDPEPLVYTAQTLHVEACPTFFTYITFPSGIPPPVGNVIDTADDDEDFTIITSSFTDAE